MKKLSIIAGLILAPLFSAQLVHQPVQSFQTEAYTSKKKAFVDKLIAKMTLDEKSDSNLPSSGDFTTGQAQSSDIGKKLNRD